MERKYRLSTSSMQMMDKPTEEEFRRMAYTFENQELEIVEVCNAIYMGQAYSCWLSGKPKTENFVCAQHIALDFDTEDRRSARKTLLEHDLFAAYGAILYPTHSHTEERPRHRMVFLLDEPIGGADGYRLALEVMNSLVDGSEKNTNAAKVWQGNGKLRDTPDDIAFYDRVLPVKQLRTWARQYLDRQQREKGGIAEHRRPSRHREEVGGNKMSLQELPAHLNRLDSYHLSYPDWVKVCCVVAREYGDAAYDIVKSWSDKDGHDPLTPAKWNSFKQPHPKQAQYGTLVHFLGGGD